MLKSIIAAAVMLSALAVQAGPTVSVYYDPQDGRQPIYINDLESAFLPAEGELVSSTSDRCYMVSHSEAHVYFPATPTDELTPFGAIVVVGPVNGCVGLR